MSFVRVALFMCYGLYFFNSAIVCAEQLSIPNYTYKSNISQFNILQTLKLADEIKSSEPKRFSNMLDELDKRKDSFSFEQISYFNYLVTYQLTFQGKLAEALEKVNILLKENVVSELRYRALILKANIYALSKNWNNGLVLLSKVIDILPKIKDRAVYEQALTVLSISYSQLGQYQLAEKYANRLISEGKNYRFTCFARNLVIESQIALKKKAIDIAFIEESIDTCKQSGELAVVSFIYVNLAKSLVNNSENLTALNLLNEHLSYIEDTNYPRVQAEAYSLLGHLHLLQNNHFEANRYAQLSLTKSSGVDSNEPIILAYKILYQLAQKQQNYKLALSTYQKYSNLNQDYLDEIQAKQLAFQLAQHQTAQKENEIELLNEQNQLLKLQQQLVAAERENDRLFMLLSLLVIFVLVFFGFRLWRTQKRLKQLAEYDALTELFNRGHFVEVAKSTLRYCQQTKQHASIIMFDLDKFKSINDNFGHAAGDWALQASAKVCLSLKREQDIVARIGGEEFCIILPSCGVFKTEQIAEKYRQALARIDTQASGSTFTVSASFGITDTVTSGYSIERLLADADEAMYQSKHNGRNQVTIFEKTDG